MRWSEAHLEHAGSSLSHFRFCFLHVTQACAALDMVVPGIVASWSLVTFGRKPSIAMGHAGPAQDT